MDGFHFHTDVKVRFAETDAQGVAHNTAYFVWFEVARVDYLARYAKSHSVEIADALIAAAAATSGLRLWTLNRKHYPMQDLRFFEGR